MTPEQAFQEILKTRFWGLHEGEIQTLIRAGALALATAVDTIEDIRNSFTDTTAVVALGVATWAKIERGE